MGAQGFRNMPTAEDSVLILQTISCKSCRGRRRIVETSVETSQDDTCGLPERAPLLELEHDEVELCQGAQDPLGRHHESYPDPTVQPIPGTVTVKPTPVQQVPNELALSEASRSSY
eukprot:TRINITY_DN13127_c0_g1_i2.p1 TRINITY_DN13127_c0_g1~~TRINITY_DN13127_c0_g1_i2.p1  ORF type:complete len:116 (+),score=13.78 TRINITY_DN13127_c0_g1_i2:217-564(+)